MGLDTSTNISLWKDKVSVEMNYAILHSFQKAGVSIVDQFSASEQFQEHFNNEVRERGGCPADWVWLTPSLSGSLTTLWHQEMLHYHLTPSYERQELMWQNYRFEEDGERKVLGWKTVGVVAGLTGKMYAEALQKRPTLTIHYATETGNAKRFSKKLLAIGNGDPPEMATGLQSWLQRKTQEEPVRKTLLKNY